MEGLNPRGYGAPAGTWNDLALSLVFREVPPTTGLADLARRRLERLYGGQVGRARVTLSRALFGTVRADVEVETARTRRRAVAYAEDALQALRMAFDDLAHAVGRGSASSALEALSGVS